MATTGRGAYPYLSAWLRNQGRSSTVVERFSRHISAGRAAGEALLDFLTVEPENRVDVVFVGDLAENATTATTLDINYPEYAVGDLFLLWVTQSTATPSPTVPAGWTSITSLNSGGVSPACMVAYKVATGAEVGALTVTTDNATSKGQIVALRNVDTGNPIANLDTFTSSTGVATYPVPSLDAPAGALLFVVGGTNSAAATWGLVRTPGHFTETADDAAPTPSSQAAYYRQAGPGATGVITLDAAAALRGFAVAVAIRPAPLGENYTASVSLSGAGSLSVDTSTPSVAASPALSGGGSLTAAPTPALAVSVALTGTGSLSTPTSPAFTSAAALSGAGSLSIQTTPNPSAAVALTGAGSLSTGTGTPAVTASPALAGTGSLAATRTPAVSVAISLSGTGSLINTALPAVATSASLSGSGSLAATGVWGVASTATLSGAGSLSTGGTPSVSTGPQLSGAGTLTQSGSPSTSTVVELSGTGSLATTRTPAAATSPNLSGDGSLTTTAAPSVTVTLNLSGTGSLELSGVEQAVLGGDGSLSTSGTPSVTTQVNLSGAGSLGTTVIPDWPTLAALSGGGSLTIDQPIPGPIVFVTLGGDGTLTVVTESTGAGSGLDITGTAALARRYRTAALAGHRTASLPTRYRSAELTRKAPT